MTDRTEVTDTGHVCGHGAAGVSRRVVLATAAVAGTARDALAQPATPAGTAPAGNAPAIAGMPVQLRINGTEHSLTLDTRVSLLDMLREHVGLTGSKKGCDHGQCGACTVLVNGRRINSCLTLAVMHHGDEITTVEGLGQPEQLHPMQAAFLHHDGYQCGYCTPGQIVSAVGMLGEAKQGWPSVVTADLTDRPKLDAHEIRERMSGNLCRCAAYVNIEAAVHEVAGQEGVAA